MRWGRCYLGHPEAVPSTVPGVAGHLQSCRSPFISQAQRSRQPKGLQESPAKALTLYNDSSLPGAEGCPLNALSSNHLTVSGTGSGC